VEPVADGDTRRPGDLLREDPPVALGVRLAPARRERGATGQHRVEGGTESVHVRPLVDPALVTEGFRSRVSGVEAGGGVAAVVAQYGEAEVGEHRRARGPDEHVVRRDVAVDHLSRVGGDQGDRHPVPELHGLRFRKRPTAADHELLERAVAQLHDHVRPAVREEARVVHADHVQVVVQPADGLAFGPELFRHRRVVQRDPEDLQRHPPPEVGLTSAVDVGEATRTDG
jgi:hypothetical protein